MICASAVSVRKDMFAPYCCVQYCLGGIPQCRQIRSKFNLTTPKVPASTNAAVSLI